MPTVLSIVLVGFIWRLILSPIWGISKDVLGFVGLGEFNKPWLGLENTALFTLGLVSRCGQYVWDSDGCSSWPRSSPFPTRF